MNGDKLGGVLSSAAEYWNMPQSKHLPKLTLDDCLAIAPI